MNCVPNRVVIYTKDDSSVAGRRQGTAATLLATIRKCSAKVALHYTSAPAWRL